MLRGYGHEQASIGEESSSTHDITGLLRCKDPEEIKSAFSDVNQQMYLSGSEIFDLLGNTLNSA